MKPQYHPFFTGRRTPAVKRAPAQPSPVRLGGALAIAFAWIGRRLVRAGQYLQGMLACGCVARRQLLDDLTNPQIEAWEAWRRFERAVGWLPNPPRPARVGGER